MVSPICISGAVFASCLGAGLLGAVGALGAFLAIAILVAASTRYQFVRRHLDQEAAARVRCTREARRVRMLRPTGPVRLHQYFELRALVEETEKRDAAEANRFDLQDLLEQFASLASHHQQCLDALRLAGSDLPIAIPIDPTRSKRRREIQARRLRHREACLTRIERIADELEAVDELIRLVAQRVACPIDDLELTDREIDRRLGELDEIDDALKQLSA